MRIARPIIAAAFVLAVLVVAYVGRARAAAPCPPDPEVPVPVMLDAMGISG